MPFCVVSFILSLLRAYFHYIYSNQLFDLIYMFIYNLNIAIF